MPPTPLTAATPNAGSAPTCARQLHWHGSRFGPALGAVVGLGMVAAAWPGTNAQAETAVLVRSPGTPAEAGAPACHGVTDEQTSTSGTTTAEQTTRQLRCRPTGPAEVVVVEPDPSTVAGDAR
jgi:hypothetical protein